MDFKSTIIIFGVALIFILPLVISSPISGAKKRGGRKTTTTTTTTTEKPKRIITDPSKAPGSKGYIKEKGGKGDEYLGGAANQWHIHNVGKHPRIKLGDNGTYTLDRNNPKKNIREARLARDQLDKLVKLDGHLIPNYDDLGDEIDKIVKTGYVG